MLVKQTLQRSASQLSMPKSYSVYLKSASPMSTVKIPFSHGSGVLDPNNPNLGYDFNGPMKESRFAFRGVRGNGQSPEMVIKERVGLEKLGTNESIIDHMTKANGYISTSLSIGIADEFSGKLNGYVIAMTQPEIGVFLPHIVTDKYVTNHVSCGDDNFSNREQEVASAESIPHSDIFMARPRLGGTYGAYLPMVYRNFEYTPRNWSIRIASIDPKESSELEEVMRKDDKLADDCRLISFDEAKMASQLIRSRFGIHAKKKKAPMLVYNTVPSQLKSFAAVDHIVDEHKSHLDQLNLT